MKATLIKTTQPGIKRKRFFVPIVNVLLLMELSVKEFVWLTVTTDNHN
ncbi:hypothetical protein CRD_02394 [Raphidiopsis brookii D9]|nr:hypothetical protein CRD_02394 [Raphidiopsis brookii D9]